MPKLNTTVLLVIMIGIGFQTAFVKSITMNLIVAGVTLLYLLLAGVKWRYLGVMFAISLPLAFATWMSFITFGSGNTIHLAWVYATRLYAYLFLGGALTLTVAVKDLLFSLHRHAHLSSTFTYGLLAAFNLLPRVRRQVKTIQYAASLRGVTYHLWSPHLYFKAVLSALQWSDDLALAMTSHGFSEGLPRTDTINDPLPKWQWLVAVLLIASYAVGAWVIQPR